jgi:hypothetical protein
VSRAVPELDYAFLAEHVRTEGAFAHVLAAGIDTIFAPTTPTGQNIGLVFRLGFTRQECGRPHRVEIVFQDEDGVRHAQISTVVTPEWTDGLPAHWRQSVVGGLNFGIPLPQYGLYSFEVMVNDENRKTLPLRVLEPPAPVGPNGTADSQTATPQ